MRKRCLFAYYILFSVLIPVIFADDNDVIEFDKSGNIQKGNVENPNVDMKSTFDTSQKIEANFQSIPDYRFDELDQILLGAALEKKYDLDEVEIKVGGNVSIVEINDDEFFFDDVTYLELMPPAASTTIINNGKDVKFKNGNITAKKADSVLKDGSIAINVEELDSGQEVYAIGYADSVMTDSLTFKELQNVTFKVNNQKVEIKFKKGFVINITDKSFTKTKFNASEGSTLIVSKTVPPYYNISNGSLSFSGEGEYGTFTETIQTGTNASVYLNPNTGFICAELMPLSTYSYTSAADTRRDFAISIPQDSSLFKICTRKDWVEKLNNSCTQCVLIDFVQKKLDIHGYATYLRHHIKAAIALTQSLQLFHISRKNASVFLTLDSDFIFIPTVRISYEGTVPEVSRTFASRYHTLYERQINGTVHRFLKTNFQLSSQELSDNLIFTYSTNYSDFDTTIKGNVINQKAGSKITILPPGHELIKKYIP